MSCEDDGTLKAGTGTGSTPSTPQDDKQLALLTPPSSSTPEELPTPLPPHRQGESPPRTANLGSGQRVKDLVSPTKKKPAPPPPGAVKHVSPVRESGNREISTRKNTSPGPPSLSPTDSGGKPTFKKPAPKPPTITSGAIAEEKLKSAVLKSAEEVILQESGDRHQPQVIADTLERRLRGWLRRQQSVVVDYFECYFKNLLLYVIILETSLLKRELTMTVFRCSSVLIK